MTDPSPTSMLTGGLSEANLRRLDRLAEDHRRFFGLRRPITAALTVALTRDIDEIRARDPRNEPEEAIPAIQAVAEAMVRKAAAGDAAAFQQIVDRIEGKVGTREGEKDEDIERHRTTVQATIEGVVETMTQRRVIAATPTDQRLIEHDDTPDVVLVPIASRLDEST